MGRPRYGDPKSDRLLVGADADSPGEPELPHGDRATPGQQEQPDDQVTQDTEVELLDGVIHAAVQPERSDQDLQELDRADDERDSR